MTTTEDRLAALQAGRQGASKRRRSPAAASKILAVGASTTAVLGIVTALGLADRPASATQEPAPDDQTAPDRPIVVVAVDQQGNALSTVTFDPIGGQTIVLTVGDVGTTGDVPPTVVEASSAQPVSTAAPVVAPTVVDLAVPVPAPAPRTLAVPAPPQAAAPAPTPQPEATSSGS